jgi:hypothetical protein
VAPASDDTRRRADYTIEAWIQPTQIGTWNRLVLRWGPAPHYAYHLAIHQGAASLYHNQAGGAYLFAEGGSLEVGRWHHVAAVARRNPAEPARSTLTAYLDGRAVGTATFDGTIRAVADEPLGIGDAAGAPSRECRFRGYIDDLAIWNRALSSSEIAQHFARRAETLKGLETARHRAEADCLAETFARLKPFGFEEIVFAQRFPGRDPAGHYYANFGYICTDPDRWLHGADGGKLLKLNLRTGQLTALVDDPQGAVRDPRVDYDAWRILFSYRKGGSHNYNLYEIGVDGSGLRQITSGAWDDVEPAWLPDGGMIFCSTRSKRYIGCWFAPSATLFRCDRNGGNLRMISSGGFSENTPAVLPDGRVLYTRWEYVNRDPVSFHHLWTVNADGAGQMVYYGNMHLGGVFIDAKPVPGGQGVVLIHSPGHGINEHTGWVAKLHTKLGPDARSALTHVSKTADFRDAYPLSDDAILAARGSQIVLMDSRGDFETVFRSAGPDLHEPAPIIKRALEPTAPSRADPASANATLILSDVYSGRNMAGVRRGSIKKLLVLEDLPKPANFHGGGSQPIGHGVTSTLKRIVGTVPVEADGSAHFEVPAMRSLYFAALDENDLSVKQMRSFVTLQPGETAACVGCHDSRTQTPHSAAGPALAAVARPASPIEPIDGVAPVMDFPRDVQPVLDRHCAKCHQPSRRDGGVILTGDHGPVYSLSYYELLLFWQVKDTGGDPRHGTGRQPGNDRPYTTYSSASALLKKCDPSHYEVHMPPQDKKTIRLWIDSGAAYAGTYAAYGTGQVGGCWNNNEPIRVMADAWPSTDPARDAVERRCGACHGRMLPRHVTDPIPLDPWGDMLAWERPLSRFSRHRIFNLTHPETSLVLLAPMARSAGGYAEGDLPPPSQHTPVAEKRDRPPQPYVHPIVFSGTADPDYRKILVHVRAAAAKLEEIRRFDMAGFKPNEHYVRELKRFGVLPASFDLARDPINPYAADEAYWRSFWLHPRGR